MRIDGYFILGKYMRIDGYKKAEFCQKTYKIYKRFACDVTDVRIYLNLKNEKTYIYQAGKKGFNQLHVNTLYALLNQVYTDVTINDKKEKF